MKYIGMQPFISSEDGAIELVVWADCVSYWWRSVRRALANGASVYSPDLHEQVTLFDEAVDYLEACCKEGQRV